MQAVERHVDLGDVQLSIAEAGPGRRPLLLVHGFTGAKEDCTPWLDRLADAGWHAVAPAHRRLVAEQPGYAEFEDRKFRATSPALYAAMAPEFVTTTDRLDSRRDLPESLPVLVIVGEQDQPFLGSSQRMAAAVGRGALEIIPDAGHCPQFENSDAWWEALAGSSSPR
ncbi:MAG: alpha/beta fold hydrolase [Streptosporangiaceae bacterium]